MIIACDPPRHALLVHFGARQQPRPVDVQTAVAYGAKIELAVSRRTTPPTLVAVHFVRQGFRLPFLEGQKPVATTDFYLHSGTEEQTFFLYLRYSPRGCEEWEVCPGVTVLLKLPEGFNPEEDYRPPEQRPELQGLRVDLNRMDVKVDSSEFRFELAPDILKDVPATLYLDW